MSRPEFRHLNVTKEAELLKTSADLHHRMLEAQQQEQLRSRIDELERQLGGLRTAAGSGGPPGDVEQDQLHANASNWAS
ncbi:MAG: hypothetical protein U0231_10510 [Nitrospiraceae bacterium]